jgi:hypothetical protein
VIGGITTYWTAYTNAAQLYHVNSNTWTQATVLPVSRGTGGGGIVGNVLVYSRGLSYSGGYVVSAETYEGVIGSNPNTITWTLQTPHPGGANYRACGSSRGGTVAVGMGGDLSGGNTGTTAAYTPSTHTWTTLATKTTACANVRNFGVIDTMLYYPGGFAGAPIATHEAYSYGYSGVEVGKGSAQPTGFALGQAYPNPARAGASIHFSLPAKSEVVLKLYDAQGSLVVVR